MMQELDVIHLALLDQAKDNGVAVPADDSEAQKIEELIIGGYLKNSRSITFKGRRALAAANRGY